jgi:hypothetical protein
MKKDMTKLLTIVASYLALAATAYMTIQPQMALASMIKPFETRCGWINNPTPGNVWLRDKENEWTLGMQGMYEAKGDWSIPEGIQWVKTNGHYGYGCVCMQVRVDRENTQVTEVKSVRARPLSACRRDPALKKKWGSL